MSTAATKLDRKFLKAPDAFMRAMRKFFGELESHRKPFLIAVGILFVGVVSTLGVLSYLDSREEAAREAFYRASVLLAEELDALNPPPAAVDKKDLKAKPATPITFNEYKKLDVDQTYPKAVAALKKVSADYGSTLAGFEARMQLGLLYLRHQHPEQAIAAYSDAVHSASGKIQKTMSLYALGTAEEDAGKFNEATETYNKALTYQVSSVVPDLLMALGRNYEKTNRKAEARKVYEQLIKEHSNSRHTTTAKTLLLQL